MYPRIRDHIKVIESQLGSYLYQKYGRRYPFNKKDSECFNAIGDAVKLCFIINSIRGSYRLPDMLEDDVIALLKTWLAKAANSAPKKLKYLFDMPY